MARVTPAAGDPLQALFGLEGRVAVVTGGSGLIGGAVARGLAGAGAKVAILARRREPSEEVAKAIRSQGGDALAVGADVLDRAHLEAVRAEVTAAWGGVDILVNCAGGAVPAAGLEPAQSPFELDMDAQRAVVELNLFGTLLPIQVFGPAMAPAPEGTGSIVNFSSLAAQQVYPRVIGYSAAKAALESLTLWLAVELGRRSGGRLRVNAIAPGFIVGEGRTANLFDPAGGLSPRGQAVLARSPAGRFGRPDDLVSTAVWLCSPASAFVSGVVVRVDGAFQPAGGV